MKKRWYLSVSIVTLVILSFVAGCGTAQPAPAPAPAPSSPAPAPAPEQPKAPIKIAMVTSRSGAFESWGTHNLRGFEIGLEYATGGTLEVNGRKLELRVYDDASTAATGKAKAEEALSDWKADIITGTISSGIALQIIPLAEQYKRVFMVEPAAADAITGDSFSRYVFRTGSNVSQDALAGAVGATKLGTNIYQLAPDYQWGHDSAKAWGDVMTANGGKVETLFAPQTTTDFTPYFNQILAKGPQVLVVHWAGDNSPKLFQQAAELKIYEKVKVTGGIADFASMRATGERSLGMTGMVKYYHTLPNNPVNDYLVKRHGEKHGGEKPDLFTGGGMAAAIAIVEGLKKTGGDPDAEKLIAALEGMSFQGPKGTFTFRKEDHQALQPMYVVEMAMNPGFDFPTPKLLAELKPEETAPPVTAKR